jgi:hypothetical protein
MLNLTSQDEESCDEDGCLAEALEQTQLSEFASEEHHQLNQWSQDVEVGIEVGPLEA